MSNIISLFTFIYFISLTSITYILQEIPSLLYNYGFIVSQVGNDGAVENRAASKVTGTINAADYLPTKFTAEELRGLNLDMPIAYRHPSPALEDELIFFGSDMPHLIKKIRNAFDNKSRELRFRDRIMKLAMIKQIWLEYESSGANLRKTHLGIDNFDLDSYKKMRVFLAMQVMSQSTIRMIKEYCDDDSNEANIRGYEGMLELFNKIDRLVDICNAYGADQITKDNRRRDVEKINHPKHRHIIELFDVLRVFEEWKKEVGGFNKHFITKQTYEDLLWLVYGIGIAGLAACYLKEDKSITFDQGRLGSDVMEHFFSMIRNDNSNPDLGAANQAAGKIGSLNTVVDGNMFKGKRGRTNTVGANVDATAYLAPLPNAKYQKRK